MKHKIKWSLLSCVLCASLLLGPVNPIQVNASLFDDDDDYGYDDGWDDDDGNGQDDQDDDYAPYDDSENSTSGSSGTSGSGTSGSTNSKADEYRSEINNINKKLEDLEKQNQELQQSINAAQSVKEKEVAAKNALDEEIYLTRSKIDLLLERIELLGLEIEAKQEEIEAKQEEHDEKFELFRQRLRAMYMYDDATTLGLIFGADDFVDFLTRTETVVRIAEHDNQLMATLMQEKQSLEQDQREIEATREQVEEDKAEYESKKDELAVQVNTISLKIQDINELQQSFLAEKEKNEALAKAMEAEITSLLEKIKWSENPYVGGEMQWPLPGFYSISSDYGWRFNNSDYHTGVDISGSGVYGKDIVAANDGEVVVANWSYTPGRGYGIYVVIDHGGNIGTLYGHCSNLVVGVGDKVTRGQKIAEVGSTGWSTGPHLHFEVRVNNAHTNPMGYLQG